MAASKAAPLAELVDALRRTFCDLVLAEKRAIELAGEIETAIGADMSGKRFFTAIYETASDIRKCLAGEGPVMTWEQYEETADELRELLVLSDRAGEAA